MTGQRRLGKSYILYQLMGEFPRRNPEAEIIYINKELHEFRELRDGEDLYRYATAAREFGNLERVKDNYPKFVVSLDETVERTDVGGIRHMNLRDFLLADLDRG